MQLQEGVSRGIMGLLKPGYKVLGLPKSALEFCYWKIWLEPLVKDPLSLPDARLRCQVQFMDPGFPPPNPLTNVSSGADNLSP